jgi:hypothetical protein
MSARYSLIIFPDRAPSLAARVRENIGALRLRPAETVELPPQGIFPERKALEWALPQVTHELTAVVDADMLLDPESTATMVGYFADQRLGCVAGPLRDVCVGVFGYFKLWRTRVLREITFAAETIRVITPDTEYSGLCGSRGWKFLRIAKTVGSHRPLLEPFNIFNIFFRVGVKQRARGRIGTAAQLWGIESAMTVGTPWAHLALFAFHCGVQVEYDGDPHNEEWHVFSTRHYRNVRTFCEALVQGAPLE